MLVKNRSSHILKDGNRMFCLYQNENNEICQADFVSNHWSAPSVLAKDTQGHLSAGIAAKGDYVFSCQNQERQVNFYRHSGGRWHNSIIAKNTENSEANKKYYIFPEPSGFTFLYNTPSPHTQGTALTLHKMKSNGQWDEPFIIDQCAPASQPFQVQQVGNGHYILFYFSDTQDNVLGYREISPAASRTGQFHPIHKTSYHFEDYSILTTKDAIHCAYIIKSAFTSQIIYRKKAGEEFSQPFILFETPGIESCVLFILENQIWLIFTAGKYIYSSLSLNQGASFTRPARYRAPAPEKILKGEYITNSRQSENQLYMHDFFVDSDFPYQPLVIPDLYPSFYPYQPLTMASTSKEEKNVQPAPKKQKAESQDYHSFIESQLNFDKFTAKIPKKAQVKETTYSSRDIQHLRTQMNQLQKQLTERNLEIDNLKTEISDNRALSGQLSHLEKQIQAVQEEASYAKEKYKETEKKYQALQKRYQQLETAKKEDKQYPLIISRQNEIMDVSGNSAPQEQKTAESAEKDPASDK